MPEHEELALQSKRHPLVVAEQVSKAHVCPDGQAHAEPEQTLEPQLATSNDRRASEDKKPKRMMGSSLIRSIEGNYGALGATIKKAPRVRPDRVVDLPRWLAVASPDPSDDVWVAFEGFERAERVLEGPGAARLKFLSAPARSDSPSTFTHRTRCPSPPSAGPRYTLSP